MRRGRWLVMYDISNPWRLSRTAKMVSQYGVRVQQSVFEVDADDRIISRLYERLERIVKEGDSVAIIPICEQDRKKTGRYGTTPSDSSASDFFEIL